MVLSTVSTTPSTHMATVVPDSAVLVLHCVESVLDLLARLDKIASKDRVILTKASTLLRVPAIAAIDTIGTLSNRTLLSHHY